jgi:Response regulator with putative antiterminator output domain
MSLRIMLVDEDDSRAALLTQALRAAGHELVQRVARHDDLSQAVERLRPDVILLDVDAPERDVLESLQQVRDRCPRPIVMFSDDDDRETIRRAVRAGVSAYVVEDIAAARLKPILEMAIAGFNEHQALRCELEEMRLRLADRRDIERAKGLLMERRGLNENQAHETLRKMAMDRKLRLGDAARALLAAAEVL